MVAGAAFPILGGTCPGSLARKELVRSIGPVEEILRQLGYDILIQWLAPRAAPRPSAVVIGAVIE